MSIKLRKKKLADGRVSLYLDQYVNGQRQYEFLRLYLGKDRAANKETLKLADGIRATKEVESQHSEHGFIPSFKRRMNFVEYFEKQAQSKSDREKSWHSSLKHLKDYTGGHVQVSAVTQEWLEDYKAYLLSKVAANTAHTYFSKVRCAMRQAVKDKLLARNPAELVGNIKTTESERHFLTLPELEELAGAECMDAEVKRAFLLSCYTGLRLSDVENLTWQNVQGDSIQFRQQKTKGLLAVPLMETSRQLIYGEPTNVAPMPTNKVFKMPSRAKITYVLRDWVKHSSITKPVGFQFESTNTGSLLQTHPALNVQPI